MGKDNGDGTFTFDWSDAQGMPEPNKAIYTRIRVGGEGVSADQIKDANGTITGGEIEDLKFEITSLPPVKPPSVTVGDFVWIDENGNGIQDDEEKGLEGVELELLGPNGDKVTDVNGQPVANIKTNSEGNYTFKDLPVLKNDEKYTVKVAKTPEGYAPTKAHQGEGPLEPWKDSSTGEASTIPGTLSKAGAQDLTLDFGFIKQQPSGFNKIPGWGWLLPLLPLIPFLGGGSSSLSSSTTPVSTTTVNSAPQHKNPSTTPAPSQHKPSASQQLAKTGASVIGLLTIAGLLVLTGLDVMNLRRKKQ
ncbi:hypothetical protein FE377_09815 [Corynebacterium diphtheriae]|nr:hypothetical protein FE377_09815 [Corynebacterium diphtheriae]